MRESDERALQRAIVARDRAYTRALHRALVDVAGQQDETVNGAALLRGVMRALSISMLAYDTVEETVRKLVQVEDPQPGDIAYRLDGSVGLMLPERNRVIVLGCERCTIQNWPIWARRWRVVGPNRASTEYTYYCPLRGSGHQRRV